MKVLNNLRTGLSSNKASCQPRPGDELVLADPQVVPLAVHVLLLLGFHDVLLLQTLEGEHGGRLGLSVTVLRGRSVLLGWLF